MFNDRPNGKGMVYGLNQIILRWKRHYGANGIYPLVYSFNGKGVVL